MSTLNGDLNQEAGGKDIFLCYKPGSSGANNIKHFQLAEEACGSGYFKVTDPDGNLNGDINQGAGGKDIFLCYTSKALGETEDPSGLLVSPSRDCGTGSKMVPAGEGEDLNGDINQEAGGKDIFLCMSDKKENLKFTDIKLVDNNKKCPDRYTLVPHGHGLNGDLNQEAGGKDIWACYINEKDKPKITDLSLHEKEDCGPSASAVMPAKDFDLNGDLNQGAGGKDIYLCYEGGTQRSGKKGTAARQFSTGGTFLVILSLAHFF